MTFAIGIDLHGVILHKNGSLHKRYIARILQLLRRLKSKKARIYTCTGNDFQYVRNKLPVRLFKIFDGHILENGCVQGKDAKEINLVHDERVLRKLTRLKGTLRTVLSKNLKYARRISTISVFTKTPKKTYSQIKKVLTPQALKNLQLVYSNVAVDFVPKGYNKYRTLKRISGNAKTIAIGDSLNDWELLKNSDYKFLPSNATKELMALIKKEKYRIIALNESKTNSSIEHKRIFFITNNKCALGLIKILEFIDKNICSQ